MLKNIFHFGLLCSVIYVNSTHAETLCVSEPLPDNALCAPEEGISPNTGQDLSPLISTVLQKSHSEKKDIYFPAGKYQFSQNITLLTYNSLIGSPEGTVFQGTAASSKAIVVGDEYYNTFVTDLTIKNIIFDNARIGFYGRKNRIKLTYNVFINTRTAFNQGQVAASTYPYLIRGNVFMRGRNYPGVGINTFANSPGLLIEHNFLGSPDKVTKAAPWLLDETKKMLENLQQMRQKGLIAFDDVQDKFVAGWYSTSFLKEGVFRNNFFSGSTDGKLYNPETGADDLSRDHVVYIKMYDNVVVAQNYFAGWPADASGQLKFRNANGLIFVANYLDNTSFNARPYKENDYSWVKMTNTYIFNNYVNNGIINYWQNFYDTSDYAMQVKNYLVFANKFNYPDKNQCLVSAQAATLSPDEFNEADNNFMDGSGNVKTCGVINHVSLDVINSRLPDYVLPWRDLQPIIPHS